jgi:hypothetical protein
MNEIRHSLIRKATRQYRKIRPCAHKAELNECFTVEDKQVLFWFNTEDESTHMIAAEMD